MRVRSPQRPSQNAEQTSGPACIKNACAPLKTGVAQCDHVMHKRYCILALTQGARVRAARHMRFDSLNDAGSYTGSSVTRHNRAFAQRARSHHRAHRTRRLSSFQTIFSESHEAQRTSRSSVLPQHVHPDSTCRRAAGIGTKGGGKETCHMRCCSAAPKAGIIARPRAVTVRGEVLSTCHCHAFTTCCVTCQPHNAAPKTVRRQRSPPRILPTTAHDAAWRHPRRQPSPGRSGPAQPSVAKAADPCPIKPVGAENNL